MDAENNSTDTVGNDILETPQFTVNLNPVLPQDVILPLGTPLSVVPETSAITAPEPAAINTAVNTRASAYEKLKALQTYELEDTEIFLLCAFDSADVPRWVSEFLHRTRVQKNVKNYLVGEQFISMDTINALVLVKHSGQTQDWWQFSPTFTNGVLRYVETHEEISLVPEFEDNSMKVCVFQETTLDENTGQQNSLVNSRYLVRQGDRWVAYGNWARELNYTGESLQLVRQFHKSNAWVSLRDYWCMPNSHNRYSLRQPSPDYDLEYADMVPYLDFLHTYKMLSTGPFQTIENIHEREPETPVSILCKSNDKISANDIFYKYFWADRDDPSLLHLMKKLVKSLDLMDNDSASDHVTAQMVTTDDGVTSKLQITPVKEIEKGKQIVQQVDLPTSQLGWIEDLTKEEYDNVMADFQKMKKSLSRKGQALSKDLFFGRFLDEVTQKCLENTTEANVSSTAGAAEIRELKKKGLGLSTEVHRSRDAVKMLQTHFDVVKTNSLQGPLDTEAKKFMGDVIVAAEMMLKLVDKYEPSDYEDAEDTDEAEDTCVDKLLLDPEVRTLLDLTGRGLVSLGSMISSIYLQLRLQNKIRDLTNIQTQKLYNDLKSKFEEKFQEAKKAHGLDQISFLESPHLFDDQEISEDTAPVEHVFEAEDSDSEYEPTTKKPRVTRGGKRQSNASSRGRGGRGTRRVRG